MTWLTQLISSFSSRPRLFGFHGGITPDLHKARSLRSVLMMAPIPRFLHIPVPANPDNSVHLLVAIGDTVLKGQKLADVTGTHAAPVHASSSGTVTSIANHTMADEFNRSELCISIETDGLDTWTTTVAPDSYSKLSREVLLAMIRDAGITGLDAAGFAAALELNKAGKSIQTLIINAAQSEPYITADQALIRERATDFLQGVKILQHLSAAQRCVIAIGRDQLDAIAALRKALSASAIELAEIAVRYPSCSEKQLIQLVTGRQVPQQGLPVHIGVLVCNVSSCYAVFNAIIKGQPMLSRITTVGGDTIATAKNLEVLIGTPVDFLFDVCGVNYTNLSRVVMGGSLTGVTLSNLDVPLGKSCNCLVAGTAQEFPPVPEPMPCIRCGKCAEVCPAQLQPLQLYLHSRNGNLDKARSFGLQDCIECGACDWICPSHIPLVHYFRSAKTEIQEQQLQYEKSSQWQQRFKAHQYRIARNEKRRLANGKKAATTDSGDSTSPAFSRDKAREEIAAAVARVKARKSGLIASTAPSATTASETGQGNNAQ